MLWDKSDEAESVVENDKDIFSYILVECTYKQREDERSSIPSFVFMQSFTLTHLLS